MAGIVLQLEKRFMIIILTSFKIILMLRSTAKCRAGGPVQGKVYVIT